MGVGGHDLAAGRRDPHGYAGSVGPIEAGDTVSITVEKIGTLTNCGREGRLSCRHGRSCRASGG